MVAMSIILLFSLAVFIGLIILQIFLSKRESKYLGLILPIICFAIALVVALGEIAYVGLDIAFIVSVLVMFLLANIPTAIFLVIYAVCRANFRKNKQLNKMNIQDLN